MKKTILLIALAAFLAVPVAASGSMDHDGPESELREVIISVSGTQAHIANAEGQTLEIYNVAGVCVATMRIDSDAKTFNLNLPKGCYILKVGKVARKISIR